MPILAPIVVAIVAEVVAAAVGLTVAYIAKEYIFTDDKKKSSGKK